MRFEAAAAIAVVTMGRRGAVEEGKGKGGGVSCEGNGVGVGVRERCNRTWV